jgi:hypothetical protein
MNKKCLYLFLGPLIQKSLLRIFQEHYFFQKTKTNRENSRAVPKNQMIYAKKNAEH